ncbi:hypothetical protein GRF29_69g1716037 [Pseudopithomyces chartarum]|uniref:Uncharacterized protein n=1 Tax=Pseudopithomyces chartarum TaxID=1892770 RepID=A0AAN6RHZ1_9PLEO|nr:hypothetical protein GRF29_69g1716037 [Pseudopithomyces chartarum]
MLFREQSKRYLNIGAKGDKRITYDDNEAWYWRFIAQAASWMILCGYLILPGLYATDDKLKYSRDVLAVFIVALLTAGYSFTALLCFACRSERFQAEAIFLPALTSSSVGLLSIAYNFLASNAYTWGTSAISGTVVSTVATFLYGMLLIWTHRRIVKSRERSTSRTNQVYNEPGCPDATTETFRINLPEDHEERDRIANSQELVGTPPVAHADRDRAASHSRPDSLSEQWLDRGRRTNRPPSIDARSTHSRAMSREERRREIELGFGP